MQGGALLAERDKDGLRDLPRLRISESAVEGGRYVHRERGRGIGHRLLKRSRQHLFEVFLIPRPALLQGFIDGDARACLPVRGKWEEGRMNPHNVPAAYCMVWPCMAGDPLAQGPIRAYSLVMAFRGPYSSRMYTPG